MKPVEDPALLEILEGKKPVSDAGVLAQLDRKKPSMLEVVKNAAVEGAAGIPDMFLNLPNRLQNLSKIPGGLGATLAGRPDLAPGMNPDPDPVRRAAEAAGLSDPNVVPQGGEQRVVDALVRGAVGGGLTGGAGILKAGTGAALGGASSVAATEAQHATDSPVAGLVAGLAVPGSVAVASKAATAAAPRLMQSALKPSVKDLKSGNADAAVRTMLDEGLNATKGGVEKLGNRISETNQKIADAILNSRATVNKNDVASRLHEPMERVSKQVNPKADVAAVERVWQEFAEHPMLPGRQIPVQLAQEMKQGTYKQLSKKYGEVGSAETEAQKALARGLKEEIANAVPEVVPLNARESSLLNARKVAEHRALMDSNKNPVGLGPLAGSAAGMATFLADRSALVKSLMARVANSSGQFAGAQGARAAIPLSFQEDAMQRQALIEALMARQGVQ